MTEAPTGPDGSAGPQGSDRVRRPRRPSRLWLLGTAVGLLPAIALATVVLPGAGGLSGRWPWVALISFRGVFALLTLGPAVLLALLALLVRRHRRVRTVVAALATVGLLATLGQVVVLGERGFFPVHPGGAAPVGGITVVVTNTDHAAADPAALTALYLAVGADVIAMPETDPRLADDVATRLAAAGRRFQVFGVPEQGRITPTSLLVSDRLGRYRQVGAGGGGHGFGEVLAEPVGGVPGRPTLVAVHPQAPVSPTLTPVWAVDTHRAIATCTRAPDMVLGGDFNSTVDHPALRAAGGCRDVAEAVGAAGVATWPQGLPRFFGAPLDHVFATGAHWRPTAAWVEPIPGSDHRALVTRLAPAGTGVQVATWAAG